MQQAITWTNADTVHRHIRIIFNSSDLIVQIKLFLKQAVLIPLLNEAQLNCWAVRFTQYFKEFSNIQLVCMSKYKQ